MEFKLNGEKIIPNKGVNPEFIAKKLNQLKDGELITTPKLDELYGVSGSYVRDSAKVMLKKNCVMVGGRWLWANEKTIKAYKAALDE